MNQDFAHTELEVERYWCHLFILTLPLRLEFFLLNPCVDPKSCDHQFGSVSVCRMPGIMRDCEVTEMNKPTLGFKKPQSNLSCAMLLFPSPVSFPVALSRKYMNQLFLLYNVFPLKL